MKFRILKIAFLIWILLWVWFVVRELIIKENLADYKNLIAMGLESKHAYITGTTLYEFIAFSNDKLPDSASYRLIGLEDGSHDKRRAVYYLYPHIERSDADFLLIYGASAETHKGFEKYAVLDDTRYILKKTGAN